MSKCIILTKHTKARMTTLSMQQKDHYTQSNYPTCALSMISGPKRTMQRCRFVFFLPGSTDCQKLGFWKAFPIQSWHCPQHVQITLAFEAGLWTRDFLSAIFWSFLRVFFLHFLIQFLLFAFRDRCRWCSVEFDQCILKDWLDVHHIWQTILIFRGVLFLTTITN